MNSPAGLKSHPWNRPRRGTWFGSTADSCKKRPVTGVFGEPRIAARNVVCPGLSPGTGEMFAGLADLELKAAFGGDHFVARLHVIKRRKTAMRKAVGANHSA